MQISKRKKSFWGRRAVTPQVCWQREDSWESPKEGGVPNTCLAGSSSLSTTPVLNGIVYLAKLKFLDRVQIKEKEANRLEGRATTAEGLLAEAKQKGDVEKGGALTAALAAARKGSDEREGELRRAMREGEAKLRERAERLENDNAALRRYIGQFLYCILSQACVTLMCCM